MNRKIKIRPEYECYSIWVQNSNGTFENLNPAKLGISSGLVHDIDLWENAYEDTYNKFDPVNSCFESIEDEKKIETQGLMIWDSLTNELKNVTIIYYSYLHDKEFQVGEYPT